MAPAKEKGKVVSAGERRKVDAVIASLMHRFPFIPELPQGPCATDIKSAFVSGLEGARKAGKSQTIEQAARTAELMLSRFEDGRIHHKVVLDVIYEKILRAVVPEHEVATPSETYDRCPRCDARYSKEHGLELRFVGIQHDLDHGECCELRLCSCGDTIGMVFRCDGSTVKLNPKEERLYIPYGEAS